MKTCLSLLIVSLYLNSPVCMAGSTTSGIASQRGETLNIIGKYAAKNQTLSCITVMGNLKTENSTVREATVVGNVLSETSNFTRLFVVGRPKIVNSQVDELNAVSGKIELSGRSQVNQLTVDSSGDSNTSGPIVYMSEGSRVNRLIFHGKTGLVKLEGASQVGSVENGNIE